MMVRWASWWFKRHQWSFMGTLPKRKVNIVLVVGPHTCYKDFILILACQKLTTMEFEFFIDPSSFKWYVRPILSALRAKKMTTENSAQFMTHCLNKFKNGKKVCFGFSTNTLNEKRFDSNPFFYDAAYMGKASVVLIAIDHHRKFIKFHNPFLLSGNKVRDLQYIRGYFENYFSYERKHNSLNR
ncbi:MAG: 1-acyl-sn-glycerol-3-phosphate acyltransferase [Flavobacteriales bacterium]|jgi:1-acyl-sn-glycerol-3-phosphate acyltransferase